MQQKIFQKYFRYLQYLQLVEPNFCSKLLVKTEPKVCIEEPPTSRIRISFFFEILF